ncbi:hypothetical protein RA272_29750, partial [Pseudomonas syringae pv. tagetis]
MIKIFNQVSPDARYEEAATGALLQSRQEEILDRSKDKRRAQGSPESDAEFKRDKRTKRATETQNERE